MAGSMQAELEKESKAQEASKDVEPEPPISRHRVKPLFGGAYNIRLGVPLKGYYKSTIRVP